MTPSNMKNRRRSTYLGRLLRGANADDAAVLGVWPSCRIRRTRQYLDDRPYVLGGLY